MPNIITRLLLEHGDYDKGLQNAQKEVGKFIDKNLNLANAGKAVVGMLGKFAAGAGAVTSAVEAAEKVIASTQTTTDAFGSAMEQAKASVDQFFYSMAKGDFSGFIEGLQQTTKYAREAYKALDDLGTFNIFKAPEVAENMAQREQLKAEIKTGKRRTVDADGNVVTEVLSDGEIAEAKKKLEQLGKDYVKIIDDTRKKEQTAYTAMSREILSGNNFQGSQEELDAAVNYYLQNYTKYQDAAEKLQKLNDRIKENTSYERQASTNQFGYTSYTETPVMNAKAEEIKNSAEYRNLQALAEIGDDTLKELMAHRVNASSATAELNRVLQSDLEALNYKKPNGGGGGGGSKKKSVVDENGELTAEAKLDFYISGDPFAIVDQAIDERGAIQIPVEIGPIDEEGFLGQDYAEQLQDQQKEWDAYFENIADKAIEASDVMGLVANGVDNLGSLIGGTAGEAVSGFAAIIDSMQAMIPVIQSITAVKKMEEAASKSGAIAEGQLAAAKAGESVAGVPLAGPALAIAAITAILGMMASIRAISFAEGGGLGIVPGANFQDGITARISSGEMVMNSHDQKNLYDAIHSGDLGGGGGGSPVLRGETIYMAVNNYLKRSGKGQLKIG